MPWIITDVIKDRDDGDGKVLDFRQGQDENNPTTDDDVRKILTRNDLNLDEVAKIDLTRCSLITDETLSIIALKCSGLESLAISWCENVTDKGIRAILQSNPNIKELKFSGCKNVKADIMGSIIECTPNITHIDAAHVGWSILPENIEYGKLANLNWFDLGDNKIKKLPKSMAKLPDINGRLLTLKNNPLESPPISSARKKSKYMGSDTIGCFYAEEMVKKSDFNLQLLDSHIKECGVNGLLDIDVDDKRFSDYLSSALSNAVDVVPVEELNDYQERFLVVRNDKELIQNLTYEGKTGLVFHAVCKSYFIKPALISFCLKEFGTKLATKKDKNGKTPLDVLMANPYADEECRELLRPSSFNNINQTGGVPDNPRDARDRLGYDIYARSIVNVTDKVESGNEANFSVGLFAPWGVGKSKMWELIKKSIKEKEEEGMAKWARSQEEGVGEQDNEVEVKDAKAEEEGVGEQDDEVTVKDTKTDAKEKENSAASAAFSKCCEIFRKGLYRSLIDYLKGIGQKSSKDDDSDNGNKSTSRDAINSDEETGNANSSDSSPLLEPKDSGNSNSDAEVASRENETLALTMFFTAFFWFPFIFLPNFVLMCITKSSELPSNASGEEVSKILGGDYIPLHIRSDDVTTGLSDHIKTALIMLIRKIPFSSMWNIFRRALECFRKKPAVKTVNVNKHIFVEFNAWVFDGSDILWASLMESLWTAVEREYGSSTVRLHRASINLAEEEPGDSKPIETRVEERRLALYNFYASVVISSVISILGVVLGLYFFDIFKIFEDIGEEEQAEKESAILEGIMSLTLLQVPAFATAWTFIQKVLPELRMPRFQSLLEEEQNQRHDFSRDTGFMGKVKQEVEYLFDLLETHLWRDEDNGCKRPSRLSIFVDDLDRCESKTVVKVLQAVKLLLDNENNNVVTCYSAIDTRLVVASIEEQFRGVLDAAEVNGYDFLEKFIQLPFCIPELSAEKKACFIERLFLERYLKNPNLLIECIRAAQERVKSDLPNNKHWSSAENYGDLVVLRDSMLPNLSKTQGKKKYVDLIRFLTEIKKHERTSKDLSNIFRGKEKFLAEETGTSVKGDEEVLCLTVKYIQHFDAIYPSLLKKAAVELTDTVSIVAPSDIPKEEDSPQPKKDPDDFLFELFNDFDDLPDKPANNIAPVESFFRSMVNPDENDWFVLYSKYLEGKPRAMTRIVNMFNVARGIAEESLDPNAITKKFQKKLIKLLILIELWPYRMSWLLQIAEDSLDEEALGELIKSAPGNSGDNKGVGHSMADVMKKFSGNHGSEKIIKIFSKVSLFEVYRKVSRVLMHSPERSRNDMARDSDPQLFEHLLLEKDDELEDLMMMSDIIPLDYYLDFYKNKKTSSNDHGHTLRPFIFNMQSHMVEKASKSMENIVIHIQERSGNGEEDTKATSWEVKYEHISTYFEKEKKEKLNVNLVRQSFTKQDTESNQRKEKETIPTPPNDRKNTPDDSDLWDF